MASPNNFIQAVTGQEFVGLLEVAIAKEPTMSRQWRGMGGFKHQMLTSINQRFLATSITTPQDKHQMITLFVEIVHGGFSKNLPTLTAVRTSLMCFHCKDVIQ